MHGIRIRRNLATSDRNRKITIREWRGGGSRKIRIAKILLSAGAHLIIRPTHDSVIMYNL
jgi:hypothetical protein